MNDKDKDKVIKINFDVNVNGLDNDYWDIDDVGEYDKECEVKPKIKRGNDKFDPKDYGLIDEEEPLVTVTPPQMIDEFWGGHADKQNLIIILGDPGGGKTASAHYFMEMMRLNRRYNRNKDQFIYKPPKDFVMKIKQINAKYGTRIGLVHDLSGLLQLQDAVVYIDEPQMTLCGDEKTFINLVTIARHRNLTLVITSAQSRFFTVGIEALCQAFVVKMCNPLLLKRGSVAQRMVKRYCQEKYGVVKNAEIEELFNLAMDEYIFYSHKREYRQFNGTYTNPLCSYWDDDISTPYRLKTHKVQVMNDNEIKKPNYYRN